MMYKTSMESIERVFRISRVEFPDDIEDIEHLRDLVIGKIQNLLSGFNRNLEDDIESGKLNALLIDNVVGSVVLRTWSNANFTPEMENVDSFSEGAGVYNKSYTFKKKEYSIFFNKGEKLDLKLPTRKFGVITPC